MNNEFKKYIAVLNPVVFRVFKRFLVENHIWLEYHRNFANGSAWRRALRHEKLTSAYNVIIQAFLFTKTAEHESFWLSIDRKWLNYLPKILITVLNDNKL